LHDEDRLSWGQIEIILKARHGRAITRDGVAKAYKRAKNPPPTGVVLLTTVTNLATGTVTVHPPIRTS
jgi:hypothetical protein